MTIYTNYEFDTIVVLGSIITTGQQHSGSQNCAVNAIVVLGSIITNGLHSGPQNTFKNNVLIDLTRLGNSFRYVNGLIRPRDADLPYCDTIPIDPSTLPPPVIPPPPPPPIVQYWGEN